MHALLVERADELMGCPEGAELASIVEAIEDLTSFAQKANSPCTSSLRPTPCQWLRLSKAWVSAQ